MAILSAADMRFALLYNSLAKCKGNYRKSARKIQVPYRRNRGAVLYRRLHYKYRCCGRQPFSAEYGKYLGKIDICIDHHGSNSVTAKEKFVDKYAAANCEIIYKLLMRMGVNFTKQIVDCLYTGISTDTGCFRYTNTTADTFRIAASLVELGCNSAYINKVMFETKSKEKIMLEREVYDTITYCANEKCAIVWVTLDMLKSLNIGEDEIEGLASIPRQIEGVLIGITMKEKEGGFFKISVRTNGDIDAAKFCSKFGGGGHKAAAGCSINGSLEDVRSQLIKAAEETL